MPGSEAKEPLVDRFKRAVLKPVDPDAAAEAKGAAGPQSVEELQAAAKAADDKERVIGLTAAPVAAAIAILTVSTQINHLKPHASTSVYSELELVLLALAVLMLAGAWFRKRMLLGIATALYGLAIFNLHWWGFGVPFVMLGAWLLVRGYRAQRDLKEATGEAPSRNGKGGSGSSAPAPSKRYTPPTSRARRSPSSKAGADQPE